MSNETEGLCAECRGLTFDEPDDGLCEDCRPRPVQVYRVVLMVIDHDGVGAAGVREVLEHTKYPNRCISPDVKSIEGREVQWTDDHPLNNRTTELAAWQALFGEGKI